MSKTEIEKNWDIFCDDPWQYDKDFPHTHMEMEIKDFVRDCDEKIDLDYFYGMIDLTAEVLWCHAFPNDEEECKQDYVWEKDINKYIKKFYPKEKSFSLGLN